ncbi:MAG: CehA/McbA family metallohydrolase [Calditrichia bacterium]
MTASTPPDVSFWLGFLLWFVIGYAEIHFRIPGLPSRLFKKEPEIVFDLPHRATVGNAVPLFLFVKDADRFPVKLGDISVTIYRFGDAIAIANHTFRVNAAIDTYFASNTFWLPETAFPEPGKYLILSNLAYIVNGRQQQLVQDNYRGLKTAPFQITIGESGLPTLPGMHWGDIHIHSNFTDDAVEFGAPIAETAVCAQSLGLSFFAITDHSFDLDEPSVDDWHVSQPNPRWDQFLQHIYAAQTAHPEICIIPGEEVSVGNSRNENVHCLLLGNRRFYPGTGDSGDRLLHNRPTLTLPELISLVNANDPDALIIAAHPFDVPPVSQKAVLNRGFWRRDDRHLPALCGWQLLNGRKDVFYDYGFEKWREALLSGKQIGIFAGTDAHGNFNNFRQVKIPLLQMIFHRQQLLGQTRTGIFLEEKPDETAVLAQLSRKRAVISNGPAAWLGIDQNGQRHFPGETIAAETPFTAQISAKSTAEFGKISEIRLITGNVPTRKESIQLIQPVLAAGSIEKTIDFPHGLPTGYLRLSVFSDHPDGEPCFCHTNPIWIG